LDTTSNQNRSYVNNGNGNWVPANGNFLIRSGGFHCNYGDIPQSSFYYKVYRLLDGQQNIPSAWTYLGTTTPGVQTFSDNGWGALGCNLYRYAIRRYYPCCTDSLVAFTLPVGKCWTADLTFDLTGCCPAQGSGGIGITVQNLIYVDSIYYAVTDPNGHAVINNVWKGNYQITYTNPQCGSPITIVPVVIMGNQTFSMTFGGGTASPPSGPVVDQFSLVATWNKPSSNYCLTGYNVYLDNVFSGFTADTVYQIPAAQVQPGVPVQLCVKALYGFASNPVSLPACTTFTPAYLYPPVSFQADTLGTDVTLTWQKPVTGSGQTPPGLLGYYLYRDNTFLYFAPSPNDLTYTETSVSSGTHYYDITAFYDISSYGYPGQYRESIRKSDTVVVTGGKFPFFEGWNNGNFGFNGWTFDPGPGEWMMNNYEGIPVPCAAFHGAGKGKSSAYEYSLVSPGFNAADWQCSEVRLQFDLKLEDISAGSTEKISAELNVDGTWNTIAEFTNNGNLGWQTKNLILPDAGGKIFRIRFRAHGMNAAAFHQWDIDNINIYGICPSPSNLQAVTDGQKVDLTWEAPCSQSTGYNIWRSDVAGNPPFLMLNSSPITTNSYTDYPVPWNLGAVYNYFVTSLQEINGCESAASDTVVASFPLGMEAEADQEVKIFPNPAKDFVEIKSNQPVLSVGIFSVEGTEFFSNPVKEKIDIQQLPAGIYLLRIQTGNKVVLRKLVRL
ncbi:MAG: T9SS type A sorting domain-containing protein, partial [Syntrophothermus sp.]